jgi:FKBP-type peptidyl-prolyl cis-trans isomerase FklB
LTRLLTTSLLLALAASAGRVEITDPTDRASYSLGHQIGEDLKRQGTEVDPEALRRGLRDGLSGVAPAMEPQEMERLLAELKRKVVAAERRQKRQAAERDREAGTRFLAENAGREGVVVLPSGLQYEVLETGEGRTPGPGDKVAVHYRSTTLDGTVFHDSRKAGGGPETLHVSGVIRGLTEALQRMREGDRWRLFLSPDLAYGRRGPLADHAVILEVELISVESAEPPAAEAGGR